MEHFCFNMRHGGFSFDAKSLMQAKWDMASYESCLLISHFACTKIPYRRRILPCRIATPSSRHLRDFGFPNNLIWSELRRMGCLVRQLFPKSAPVRFGCKQRKASNNTGVGYGGAVSARSGGTPVRTVRAQLACLSLSAARSLTFVLVPQFPF